MCHIRLESQLCKHFIRIPYQTYDPCRISVPAETRSVIGRWTNLSLLAVTPLASLEAHVHSLTTALSSKGGKWLLNVVLGHSNDEPLPFRSRSEKKFILSLPAIRSRIAVNKYVQTHDFLSPNRRAPAWTRLSTFAYTGLSLTGSLTALY